LVNLNEKTLSISVVIPVFNNANQLRNCLDSILESLYYYEVIVIDGGSTDDTLAVIGKYTEYISYWESGLDSGIGDAFNRGINQATGDIIAILNSDDYWHKDTLSLVVEAFEQSPGVDVLYGDLQFLDESVNRSYIKKPDITKMKFRMNIFHPAMFVRRSAYEKVGLYRLDYKHAMDSEWCHRALAKGLKFEYTPYVLTTMRLGGVSDREFKESLQEYRKSVILNGLAKPWLGWLCYYYYYFMKSLMSISWFRSLKYKLQNN